MGVDAEVATSQGDVMRRLRKMEKDIERLHTDRRLESAAIGAGGLRIQGGVLRIQDITGDDMFRAGGDPGELFIRGDLLTPLVEQIVEEVMTSPAGQDLAAFVFATRIHSDTVSGGDSIAGQTSFVDLSPPGPTVPNVDIVSGKAIVMLTCQLQGSLPLNDNGSVGGHMGVQISGATSVAPDVADGTMRVVHTASTATNAANRAMTYRATYMHPVSGLNPGVHTFTAKYRNAGAATLSTNFANRAMTVIAL